MLSHYAYYTTMGFTKKVLNSYVDSVEKALEYQVLTAILDSIPPHHRRALFEFYGRGCGAKRAAELAGMGLSAFIEMKSAVRAQYRAAIGRPDPPLDRSVFYEA
jgi:DNA-directed RNA polymerase specialized sigma24 family protein